MMQYRQTQYGFGAGMTTNVVKKLLITNVVIFLLMNITRVEFVYTFGLVPKLALSRLYVWQFFTYMFLHGSLGHLFFNMYALWIFGSEIERMWGSNAFLKYYLVTGIGGGLFYALINSGSVIPTIGASGAVYGIMTAFAVLFPNRELMLLFPPIAMKAKTMVMAFLGLELFLGMFNSSDGIAHLAHLGGAVVGYLYMKQYHHVDAIERQFKQWNRRRKMKLYRKKEEENEVYRRRVDEILDKVNRIGFENLTDREKNILKEAGHHMGDDS